MKCVTLCLFKQEKAFNHVHSDGNKSIQKKYIYLWLCRCWVHVQIEFESTMYGVNYGFEPLKNELVQQKNRFN